MRRSVRTKRTASPTRRTASSDTMTPGAFISKWRASELKKSSASQEHFNDLCPLLAEPTPPEAYPAGEWYCFERGMRKNTGGRRLPTRLRPQPGSERQSPLTHRYS